MKGNRPKSTKQPKVILKELKLLMAENEKRAKDYIALRTNAAPSLVFAVERLMSLLDLVNGVVSEANRFSYSTLQNFREWLTSRGCYEWSDFREKAEELSRPYPTLRPMLGRFYIALNDLVEHGRNGCLRPETYRKLLLSEANPCHAPYCELNTLANQLSQAISRLCVGG